ncbi:MAG: 16S rRNA (cytosine(1402)-N(4))-methyltransferase RsmH [Rickettsiales bacterium]|jgi:16S rRNA (cytosine1402-N4)-methyltransferase|nr:16S rRNA (cytosine(1402)-N(4))-methyltransferase RsmH [Rickettsiales bacterium]
MTKHIPVLLDRVLETLGDIRGKTVVDGTFGAGGYSRAFLAAGANVIAFDRDPNVAADADKIKREYGDRFNFIQAPFSNLKNIADYGLRITDYHAVVFDFGVSSMQIDTAERGFSFRFDGPLDMRMDQSSESARELIGNLSADELSQILRDYGDVRKAKILANAMKKALPKTTFELKSLIHNPKDVAPVFQALRIAVNDELGEMRRALDGVREMLSPGGMCLCVTFHSLEDRLVKSAFRDWTTAPGDPRLPLVASAGFRLLKTFTPSDAELAGNPRARSAHLRGVIKESVKSNQ